MFAVPRSTAWMGWWLINSDVTSVCMFMGCIGAAAHIVRPGEPGERTPAPEQIRTGVIVAALAAVGLAMVHAPGVPGAAARHA